ncbi:hypothetical protein [Chryseobacterium sp. 3008163]|uniref:hypothetical protein n=1 Tax=Chryseobacterium sp. 3008163 TaxID=2478663 RepID=UPI001013CBB0|nr:hypothetical protein [Chryseobacterium sp. 3008163]
MDEFGLFNRVITDAEIVSLNSFCSVLSTGEMIKSSEKKLQCTKTLQSWKKEILKNTKFFIIPAEWFFQVMNLQILLILAICRNEIILLGLTHHHQIFLHFEYHHAHRQSFHQQQNPLKSD